MVTRLYTHRDCLMHQTPLGHPEQVARLEVITQKLEAPAFDGLDRHAAPLATDDDLLLCHPQSYLDRLAEAEPEQGLVQLDGDTLLTPQSLDAARRGVGAVIASIDAVLAGEADNAFCATRPPGHHAEQDTPMGFCFFGSIAIGARHALERCGLERVAVIDFDVHHGNGTQALLANEQRAVFASSHQMPLWPGSGEADDRGPLGNIYNLPLVPYSTGTDLLDIYNTELFPKLEEFAPQMILISAGFDAHEADPLANLNFSTDEFAQITRALKTLAGRLCKGRIVSTLEGGYDLDALAEAVGAHVSVLMEA